MFTITNIEMDVMPNMKKENRISATIIKSGRWGQIQIGSPVLILTKGEDANKYPNVEVKKMIKKGWAVEDDKQPEKEKEEEKESQLNLDDENKSDSLNSISTPSFGTKTKKKRGRKKKVSND
jgi:hypothetical protein